MRKVGNVNLSAGKEILGEEWTLEDFKFYRQQHCARLQVNLTELVSVFIYTTVINLSLIIKAFSELFKSHC